MLNIEIRKQDKSNIGSFVVSKKIAIESGMDAVIQISHDNRNLPDLIQNMIIDLLLGKVNMQVGVYDSFSIVLEKLNRNLRDLGLDYDLTNLNIFIGIIDGSILHFSILNNYKIYLIKNSKIVNLADGMESEDIDFSYISSGNIGAYDNVYISNLDFLDYLTKDDISDISKINSGIEHKVDLINQILAQEAINQNFDILALNNNIQKQEIDIKDSYIHMITSKLSWGLDKFLEVTKLKTKFNSLVSKVDFKNKYLRGGLFGLGMLVSITLLYLIISSLVVHKANNIVSPEYKNKLLEARTLLEKASKDLGNKDIFNQNIKKAEDIIFEVREKQVFITDVNTLLNYISVLKKQFNGIESTDLKVENNEIMFENKDFAVKSIFELNKRLYFVGKNSLMGPYIKGSPVKAYAYPDGEEAVAADITADGYIYILTKSYRVLRFYKQDFKYVNVEGQKTWEESKQLKLFNSNLYLLSPIINQILKHKPGINGFSSKSEVIATSDLKNLKVIDFAIDGGFYILKSDLSIDKIFTTPTYSKKSIVINGLPDNYNLNNSEIAHIYAGQNLNYVYVLIGNKIWMFEPDTKNYKDVKSLKYLGQLEISNSTIDAIYIPKDGNILVGNPTGAFRVNFEISDGKIIVR